MAQFENQETESQVMACAQSLGQALAESRTFLAMREAEDALALDGVAQQLLEKAEAVRGELREQLEAGRNPQDMQDKLKELRDVNLQMEENPVLKHVADTREAFQRMMKMVNAILKFHVGGDESCGGDCDSCGGGCH
nr:YlbF family regulator [bacterium]